MSTVRATSGSEGQIALCFTADPDCRLYTGVVMCALVGECGNRR